MRIRIISLISAALVMVAGTANAGNIILTGHDVLLHGGQGGFDTAALNYIRDGAATYNIAVIGVAGNGSGSFTGGSDNLPSLAHGAAITLAGPALSGLTSAVFWNAASIVAGDFAGIDAIVIMSHENCGGCSMTDAGSAALNLFAAEIATAFNAGMDIWANAGSTLATFYDFLPPAVATVGSPISDSSGFTCTADGLLLFGTDGCSASSGTGSMINNRQTHNRFSGFDPDFTVFEEHLRTGAASDIITIGLRGGTISDDGISTDDGTTSVPEPGTLSLLGLGLLGLGAMRRRRKA